MQLEEAYVEVRLEVQNLTKDLARMRTGLDKHFEDIEKRARQAGLAAVAAFTGAVAVGAGLIGRSFIQASMSMEKMKLGLVAVTGSAQEAGRQLAVFREIAKMPGLGFPEVIAAGTALQAVGMGFKETTGIIKEWGNELVRMGKGKEALQHIVLQLTQIRGRTGGFGEDLRVIAEIMPSIRKHMMTAFGTASSEELAKMGVTGADFIAKITEQLAKQQRVMGGAQNSVDNLKDSYYMLKVSIGDILLPAFQKLLDMTARVVSGLEGMSQTSKAIMGWGTVSVAGIASVTGSLALLGLAIPKIIAGVKLIGNAFTWLAKNPIGTLGASILALTATMWAAKRIYDAWITPYDAKAGNIKATTNQYKAQGEAIAKLSARLEQYSKWGAATAEIPMRDMRIDLDDLSKSLGINVDEMRNAEEFLAFLRKEYTRTGKEIKALKGEVSEPLGPPEPVKIKVQGEALKDIQALIQAQGELKSEQIRKIYAGGGKSPYPEERRQIMNTYVTEKKAIEAALADTETSVAQKAVLHEKLVVFQEKLNNDLTASYMEQGDKLSKASKDLADNRVNDLKDVSDKAAEILQKELDAMGEFNARSEALAIKDMQNAIDAAEKTADEKKRQEQELSDYMESIRQKEYAKYKTSNDAMAALFEKAAIVKMDVEKEKFDAIQAWNAYLAASDASALAARMQAYDSISAEDKELYAKLTGNVVDWKTMSVSQLKQVENIWNASGKTIAGGWKAAIAAISMETINWSNEIYDVTQNVKDAFAELFANTLTDMDNFKSIWRSFWKDINDILVKAAAKIIATKLLETLTTQGKGTSSGTSWKSIIGMVVGGVLGGLVGQPGIGVMVGGAIGTQLQEGGIVTKPTFAMIGEKGPEAVIPLRGRSSQMGGMGSVTIQTLNLSLPYANLENIDHTTLTRFVQKRLAPALREAAANGYINPIII